MAGPGYVEPTPGLIRARALPLDHAERLHAWVRPRYRELWQLAQVRDDY